jgi:hypothetical protein
MTVERMRIWPRPNPREPAFTLGFPEDFIFQYVSDEECNASASWQPLSSYFSYRQPLNTPLEFLLPRTEVNCIRIIGTELSPDDYGSHYLQLGEIELFYPNLVGQLTSK